MITFTDVYIDQGKKSYTALKFKKLSLLQLIPAIASDAARKAKRRAEGLGLGGNMAGDGWQNGGCLVVEKGGEGEPLLYYIQRTAPAIIKNTEILKVRRE